MPLPVVVALVITKGVTLVGPTHEYLKDESDNPKFQKEEAFPNLLGKQIQPYILQRLQLQVDSSVNLFVQLHTMLVLLQGATLDFTESTSERYKNEPTITVNAFWKEEILAIERSKTVVRDADNQMRGKRISTSYNEIAECLKKYLDIVKNASLLDTFKISESLKEWQETIGQLDTSNKKACMSELLKLVRFLFSEVNVDEALAWAKNAERQGDANQWLDKQLSADGLWQKVEEYYASPNATNEGKMALSRIREMLEKSCWFYNQISYEVPEEPSEGNNRLGQDFQKAIQNLPENHQESWHKLRLALHGAVAWYIYRLCAYAVDEVKAVVGDS